MEDTLKQLITPRLLLRPFEEGDYPLILKIAADPDTTRYLYYWARDGLTPEEDARRFLNYALKNWARLPIRAREYCVTLRQGGQAIGDGSIEWVENERGTAEIGWILLPEHRGNGYVTEMGRELLRVGFESLGAERIIAHCDARNAPSYRVMKRLGMRLEHIAPGARPAKAPGDVPGDEYTCAILRTEWAARAQERKDIL